jgi:hypothetical protein
MGFVSFTSFFGAALLYLHSFRADKRAKHHGAFYPKFLTVMACVYLLLSVATGVDTILLVVSKLA